jgi:threonine dehydrogenase-like Zn-dependent dehydrogenase
MRAPFQAGDFPAPVKYGYTNVGVVETGPAALAGRTVFCLHPHQTRYVVPADAVHVVPDDVPAARAVLAANMETAINGVWDGGPQVGDRIAVIGGGVVGCLVAWLAGRIPECRVELVDTNGERAAIASRLGVGFATPDRATPGADLVFHASGAPEGLATALRLAAFEAVVVELSWYGAGAVPVPLGEAFHSRRLTLRASQVGAVAATQRSRWTHRRRMALALALLVDPCLDDLITGESPFEALPEVMAELARGPGRALCHRIAYR